MSTKTWAHYTYEDKGTSHIPEDGELIGTAKATYDYAGFHREKLDGSITLKDGETFSIVAEETVEEDGKTLYEYAANISYTKAHAEAVRAQEAADGISSDDRDRNADEYGIGRPRTTRVTDNMNHVLIICPFEVDVNAPLSLYNGAACRRRDRRLVIHP